MNARFAFFRVAAVDRLALALGIFALSAASPAPSAAQPQRTNGEIRVETNLVSVLASVQMHDGTPVTDLPKDAFSITEEGVPQEISRFEAQTDQPLDLALMVDTSLSALKDLKIEGEAAAQFIRSVVRPGDRLAVFEFSDEVTQVSSYSSSVATLQEAARRLTPGAGTSLYDAVFLGARSLAKGAPERRRAIVVVTDAGETTSRTNFDSTRQTAIGSGALLFSIVIRNMKSENGRNTAGEHALATITDDTGGAMYFPDGLNNLGKMFEQINQELRTQYLLGYYPRPTPPPGAYRHIDVRVKGDYILRSRKEYLTSGAAR